MIKKYPSLHCGMGGVVDKSKKKEKDSHKIILVVSRCIFETT